MIPYTYRFHGHNSLSYTYKNGTVKRGQYMTIRYVKNPRRKTSRLAVVVSKKVYKGAVGRNRIRRRVYEWFRPHIDGMEEVYDIVCIITSADVCTLPADTLSTALQNQTIDLFAPTDKK